MSDQAVSAQPTPNPNAMKFTVAGGLPDRERRSFASAADAAGHRLGAAIFALGGVQSLFMVNDFVTVTKAPEAAWAELAPRVIATLADRLGAK